MQNCVSLLVVLCTLGLAQAGFRCSLGELACSASCVTLGQTSGICDAEGDCICSEKSISLNNFRNLLPSRCNLGLPFCEATCNALGRESGTCAATGATDCQCSENFISPKAFALCAAESTCRLDCQRQGLATGECFGWACKCQSKKNQPIPDELKDLKE
eukprot:TRINITY_DN60439_c0_g1_i1.p1 TRINITY_DN60439_c0_g1~~TRINITY_DN60439_c0_g1_i1.p1  ORF type:complete len:159 (+),score=40.12 TRINITY_DN60439_c0_g1_i1:91-567(+)